VKVEVEKADGLKRKLVVEIPADTVKSEENKQLTDFRKRVELKGFRKGKVPMNMIKSLYGNEVKAMVADEIVKSSYPEAVRESALRVASYPNVTALKFTEEGGLNYTVEVEVFPELETVKYDGLKLKASDTEEVPDEAVEEIVSMYRVRYSETRKAERAVEEGDVVIVDMQKVDDPRGIMPEAGFADVEIDLAKQLTVKEFKEQIPGMKVGDEKEITVQYADDYPNEKFAGATITYKVKLNEVKERILPEFNDALAKQTGQAETALELRMKIREELNKEKQEIARNAHRQQLIKQLCNLNPIQIPDALVDEYLEAALKDVQQSFPEATKEDVEKEYRESGIESIRWNILFHRLADQEHIEVLPEDTENWIKRLAENNNMPVEQAKEALNRSGRLDGIRDSILEEKVLDFLAEKAEKTTETS